MFGFLKQKPSAAIALTRQINVPMKARRNGEVKTSSSRSTTTNQRTNVVDECRTALAQRQHIREELQSAATRQDSIAKRISELRIKQAAGNGSATNEEHLAQLSDRFAAADQERAAIIDRLRANDQVLKSLEPKVTTASNSVILENRRSVEEKYMTAAENYLACACQLAATYEYLKFPLPMMLNHLNVPNIEGQNIGTHVRPYGNRLDADGDKTLAEAQPLFELHRTLATELANIREAEREEVIRQTAAERAADHANPFRAALPIQDRSVAR